LELEIKNNTKDVEIYRYPEQGHAFLDDDDWIVENRKELGFVKKDIEPFSAEGVRDQAWVEFIVNSSTVCNKALILALFFQFYLMMTSEK
jgi:hypothetical protein